ncbi:nitroreductase family protein [Virgibacillus byunsanensis]|uniref:Nitroreductase family protein n=1 Tax=Virgibacillus byunsanensis TaxID=570945 RepID=A0ABW3LJ66_9BACI
MTKEKVWSIFDSRVSVRSYSDRPVDEETVDLLLKCATTAPSNGNMQPWEFIVVRSEEMKEKLVRCTFLGYHSKGGNHQNWIKDASVVIVCCANHKRTKARYGEMGYLGSIIDVAAATQNLLLAISNIGLASCWVGGFDEEKLKNYLNIPIGVKPVGVIPIGYPANTDERKNRLPVDVVKHLETYHSEDNEGRIENAN